MINSPDSDAAAQLLKIFTPDQLIRLSELAAKAVKLKYAQIEINFQNDRIFVSFSQSIDFGKLVK